VVASPLAFAAQCVATDGTAGANCSLGTSANAISPGLILDTKRTVIQLSQLQVLDGGSDGLVATQPNAVFAVQGIFAP
jgi:hypothetical protein